ncbi:hypothetical protein XF_1907 [Xylella fastidiosa 9a5c]|uniref:Uncharacterized protein n=1 Tax=Xylella fastidiosa (strain 9a5c) TaxID=160492 RepID=Q9PC74_XYLFA|nr:hypothetical protein XF_1907 [Xylella fastidiosa 9a5c]
MCHIIQFNNSYNGRILSAHNKVCTLLINTIEPMPLMSSADTEKPG